MAKINVDIDSPKDADQTYQLVKNYLENEFEWDDIDSSINLDFDDSSKSGKAKGSRFSAEVSVEEQGSASKVGFEIEVPFVLLALKGKITSTLQSKLDELLS